MYFSKLLNQYLTNLWFVIVDCNNNDDMLAKKKVYILKKLK